MISEQGAILIATVYPIGLLLLLLVEGVGAFDAFVSLFGKKLRTVGFVLAVVEISAVLMSVLFCVYSVSSETALGGFQAGVVAVSGVLLMLLFSLAAGVLLAKGTKNPFLRPSKKADDE